MRGAWSIRSNQNSHQAFWLLVSEHDIHVNPARSSKVLGKQSSSFFLLRHGHMQLHSTNTYIITGNPIWIFAPHGWSPPRYVYGLPHSRPIFLDIDWIPVFAYSVTSPAARPSMDTRCAANCADLYICLICLPCLPPQFGYGFKCRPPTLFIHLFRFHLIVPFSCSLFILTMTTRPSLVHHAFISRDLTELFYILYCICINTTCILLQASVPICRLSWLEPHRINMYMDHPLFFPLYPE